MMSSHEQAMMYPAEDAMMAWTEDTSLRKGERNKTFMKDRNRLQTPLDRRYLKPLIADFDDTS